MVAFIQAMSSTSINDPHEDEPSLRLEPGDLPLGPHLEDQESVTRLCRLYSIHRASWTQDIAREIESRLKNGEFHHNSLSNWQPPFHPIVSQMRDQVGAPMWPNMTYPNWFIVVGIYGDRIRQLPLLLIGRAMSARYGWDLLVDLHYHHGPRDDGQHMVRLLTQVTQIVHDQERKMCDYERRITALEETVGQLAVLGRRRSPSR
ncbi:hypothetical protein ACHAPT_001494 [Fusarium lateritium]